MIHSMSGGVISDVGAYTFVKVRFDDGTAFWFISEIEVAEGDRVKAPRGTTVDVGTVEKVERGVSGQVTPVPLKRARRIIRKVD